jgi:hypothetical protein
MLVQGAPKSSLPGAREDLYPALRVRYIVYSVWIIINIYSAPKKRMVRDR